MGGLLPIASGRVHHLAKMRERSVDQRVHPPASTQPHGGGDPRRRELLVEVQLQDFALLRIESLHGPLHLFQDSARPLL